MSFGWSAGDLVICAKIAYEVFSYYQNAPQNLRQTIKKFHYVAEQLEDLSDVLQKSGWKRYDKAPGLRADLENARSFFERYDPLPNASSAISSQRFEDTPRLDQGPDQNKLRDIEEGLKDHMDRIVAFKQHVILVCSLQNLQLAQKLHARSPSITFHPPDSRSAEDVRGRRRDSLATSDIINSSRFEADNDSILSNAASAITLAKELKISSVSAAERGTIQSTSQKSPQSTSGSPLDAPTTATEWGAIHDFIDEVVGLSEELQLYSKNPSQPQSPQQLAKITSTAMQLCNNVRPQQRSTTTSPHISFSELESPIESFRDSIFSSITRETQDTGISAWSPFLEDRTAGSLSKTHSSERNISLSQSYADAATSPGRDVESKAVSRTMSEAGSFIMDIGLPAKEPLTFRGMVRIFEPTVVGLNPIPCTLDFAEASETTLYCTITAMALNQRRRSPTPRSGLSSVALTPQTHLDMAGTPSNPGQSRQENIEHRRIFHHKFSPAQRPFPHTLHPSVEGPRAEKDAPYTITFTVPQYFEEEGLPHPPSRSVKLKYIFSAKEDRDVLQSLIFGKVLLFTAGINKVMHNSETERSQQSLRLWQPVRGGARTMTVFFRDTKLPAQKLYKELVIHSNDTQVRKLKPGDPVKISVVEASLSAIDNTRRPSSTTSARTLSSRGSILSTASIVSKPTICAINFSSDASRAEFLRLVT